MFAQVEPGVGGKAAVLGRRASGTREPEESVTTAAVGHKAEGTIESIDAKTGTLSLNLPRLEGRRRPHADAQRRHTAVLLVNAIAMTGSAWDMALQFPGVFNAWTMPIKARIDMLSTGIRTPIGIKVFGKDLGDASCPGRHGGAGPVPGLSGSLDRSRWAGDDVCQLSWPTRGHGRPIPAGLVAEADFPPIAF